MNRKSEQDRFGGEVDERVSMRVIRAVAAAEHVPPAEIGSPLYQIVDPEALDRLYTTDPVSETHVTFEYAGHTVDVTREGQVSVDGIVYDPSEPVRHEVEQRH